MTLAGVHSVEAAVDFIARYEQECFARPRSSPSAAQRRGAVVRIAGVVERLLIEERRRMIDAQLAWISYARAELRAAESDHGAEDEPR